jgi:UDP-glucose 4-epimerase
VNALVTGGAGFLGSTLVDRLLAAGHAVDVVDDLSGGSLANLAEARADRSHSLKVHQADLRSPEVVDLIARRRPEVVFHLAARPGLDVPVNVLGSVHVLEGCRAAGARKVVYAADGTTLYGRAAGPVRESAPHEPLSPHGVSKKVVLDYLQAYRSLYDLEFTALALATVYGPRQVTGPVADLARGAAAAGGAGADLVYVDDAVDAFVRAAERGSGVLCNVGTGVATPFREVARRLPAVEADPAAPPLVGAPALDPGRARIHLGWEPWTSLDEGIRQLVRSLSS